VVQIHRLWEELRRLGGPSEEDVQASKLAAARQDTAEAATSKLSEEVRFPRLKELTAPKDLPSFTRAEVARHNGRPGGPAGTEPWVILHNKVYDLAPLLQCHPGGDDVLLSRAGTDATEEFELFEHSEKARARREQELLVGEVVPSEHTDWAAEPAVGGFHGGGAEYTSEMARYLRYKAVDAVVACAVLYAYKSYQNRKPLSRFGYSRGLRHLHLIMAVGIAGALGSAQAASRAEGMAKKRLLNIHKQTGFGMLVAWVVRFDLRLKSGIPPRFPGHPVVKFIETQSLRAFYVFILVLPLSGMANEYFLKWADGDEKRNEAWAQRSMQFHTRVGKLFQLAWLPFHLGYTTVYHYSKGRGVVRKVSPFI
jgi:cytochrome b561/cytochrome b involved in lipid metabolism